ncbi:MAG: SCO family protein [Verrucomicrobiota bacterium]
MRVPFLLLVGCVCFSACKPRAGDAEVRALAAPEERLRKYWQLPEFALQDHNSVAFASSQMKGKLWIVDFFYSSCPGPCPMLSSRLSGIHKQFKDEPRVGFLSVSSDPEKDTPEVLAVYAKKFGVDNRWFFLTGPKQSVYRLANEGFKLSLQEVVGAPEPISHSTRLALVDQDGWVRGFYEGVGDESEKATLRLMEDIRQLLNQLK